MAKRFPFEEDFVLGMKSNWRKEHVKARLDAVPDLKLMELFIGEYDLEEHCRDIENSMRELDSRGVHVMLHEPTMFKGFQVNAAATHKQQQNVSRECHQVLDDICERHTNALGFIAHGYNPSHPESVGYIVSYHSSEKRDALYSHMIYAGAPRYNHVFVENVPRKIFAKQKEIVSLALDSKDFSTQGIGICLDLPSVSMTYKHKLFHTMPQVIEDLAKQLVDAEIPTYFHIADERWYMDALEVGTGRVNFARVLPHIKVGIIEVRPRNELNPIEAVRSYKAIMGMYDKHRFWELTKEAGDRVQDIHR